MLSAHRPVLNASDLGQEDSSRLVRVWTRQRSEQMRARVDEDYDHREWMIRLRRSARPLLPSHGPGAEWHVWAASPMAFFVEKYST